MSQIIYTPYAPAAIGPYSQAVVAGGLVFTSGQIPINPATGEITAQGIRAQAVQVCENLKAVLEAAGSSLEKEFNEVYAGYFTGKPARSCVAVKALPRNVLVEIEVIAEV